MLNYLLLRISTLLLIASIQSQPNNHPVQYISRLFLALLFQPVRSRSIHPYLPSH